jgi:hypothetical protein
MIRTALMLAAVGLVLPQDLSGAKDLGVTGLALFLAIVLANIVTKLVDRRTTSPESTVLRQIEAGMAADTAAKAAMVSQLQNLVREMRTAETLCEQRHAELLRAIEGRAA